MSLGICRGPHQSASKLNRRQLGRKARESYAEICLEIVGERLLGLYEEELGGRNRARSLWASSHTVKIKALGFPLSAFSFRHSNF